MMSSESNSSSYVAEVKSLSLEFDLDRIRRQRALSKRELRVQRFVVTTEQKEGGRTQNKDDIQAGLPKRRGS